MNFQKYDTPYVIKFTNMQPDPNMYLMMFNEQ